MAYTSIDNPELYFQTKIYTGNGTNSTAITLDDFQFTLQSSTLKAAQFVYVFNDYINKYKKNRFIDSHSFG